MADDLVTLGMLVQPGGDPPVFASAEQVVEYHNDFLYQKSDEGYIDYVATFSRKGWLIYALEMLCNRAGISSLGFLYGSKAVQYEWTFVQGENWFLWKGLTLKPGDIDQAVSAISTLLDWSRQHVSELGDKDFLGHFADDD